MSALKRMWPFLIAVVIGLTPMVDIAWHLVQNRMPGPWWWSTRVSGWPSFVVLAQVFEDEGWVPMNVADMRLSRHVFRWCLFLLVNTGVWVLVVVSFQKLLRAIRSHTSLAV